MKEEAKQKEILLFAKYIGYIKENLEMSSSRYYCSALGKCIILGICGILSNKTCMDDLKQKMNLKLFLLTIFINLMIYHKKVKTYMLNKITKKDKSVMI